MEKVKHIQAVEMIDLKHHGLFGSRDTMQEVMDYVEKLNGSEMMVGYTVFFLLYNTIANNYFLVEKNKNES